MIAIKSVIDFLSRYWPVFHKTSMAKIEIACRDLEFKRSEMRAENAKKIAEIKKNCAVEKEAFSAQARQFIDRCCKIDFRRDTPMSQSERYTLMIQFDTRMASGFQPGDDLRFLGKMIGRQVEDEIATSRFVASANDLERERVARCPRHP